MITLLDIRNEAVRQIREGVGDRRVKVAAHPGRFSEDEIKRLANGQTPAVLTSFLKYHDGNGADESHIDFVSWVLCRANSADKLFDGGLELVSNLTAVIRNLDADCAYNVRNIEAENLYTGTLGAMNVTLWAVSWRWAVRGSILENGEAGITLPDGLEIFEGADSVLTVGSQSVEHTTNMEV